MNKRQVERDQKTQARAIAKANRKAIARRQDEQSYQLQLAKDQALLESCDDSPNLAAEFVLVRQIIQHQLKNGVDSKALLPFVKIEESLARSMMAMSMQLAMMTPATSLREAAIAFVQAVDEVFSVHAPHQRAEAVDWLKNKLGTALLDTDERDEPVEMQEAKQQYQFDAPPASPNLSLGGSLRLLRFWIQQSLDDGNFDFTLLLIKQLITTAHTQLSLAKVEGLIVSREVSQRLTHEMVSLVSQCIGKFAENKFDTMIDATREKIMGPPSQQYRITQ